MYFRIKKHMSIIAPSLLSANFYDLKSDMELLNQSEAEWLHIDVMDGRFVPNISFGVPIMKALEGKTDLVKDVHLMIVEPEQYFQDFIDAGADYISFHLEATSHPHRAIQQIKNAGAKASIALNPHTPIDAIQHLIPDLDMVLLMSVNPGFGGQKFIEFTLEKVQKLKQLILEKKASTLIQVDGGVNLENAPRLRAAGVDVMVAGNTVFSSEDPLATIKALKYS